MRKQDIERINKILVKRLKCNEVRNLRSGGYNCWGFTAYSHGITDVPQWLREKEMNKLLKQNFYEVDTPRRGDVVAWYGSDGEDDYCLLHTALYLHNGFIIHKEGERPVEIATVDKAHKTYAIDCGCEIKDIRYWRKK